MKRITIQVEAVIDTNRLVLDLQKRAGKSGKRLKVSETSEAIDKATETALAVVEEHGASLLEGLEKLSGQGLTVAKATATVEDAVAAGHHVTVKPEVIDLLAADAAEADEAATPEPPAKKERE